MSKYKPFENGVKFFTHASAVIDIHFPEDEVMCHWCPYCRSEENLERNWCRLTNEMLYNPFSRTLGERCPLVFDVDINEPVQQVDKEVLGVQI